ncbi:BrnT family toxin [Candidatus Thioglobus sp.]|uniref:BrnT family toxin n=1 Tax=Candidatus Thioglobus sp. TaxID=2026721 RepID=UPI003D0CE591
MKIEFDTIKNKKNIQGRGIDFNIAIDFDLSTSVIIKDERHDYGEKRFAATGYIETSLFVMVFTIREVNVRIISLRRANKRERRKYEQSRISRQ